MQLTKILITKTSPVVWVGILLALILFTGMFIPQSQVLAGITPTPTTATDTPTATVVITEPPVSTATNTPKPDKTNTPVSAPPPAQDTPTPTLTPIPPPEELPPTGQDTPTNYGNWINLGLILLLFSGLIIKLNYRLKENKSK